MSDAILVENLTKTYKGGVKALQGVSFRVEQGEIFGLLGPNGAGKSTTVRILSTLTRADGGRAEIAGHDVMRDPAAVRRAIGYVAQSTGVDRWATGRENLTLQAQMLRVSSHILRDRVAEMLNWVNLSEAADKLVNTYSGGMKRRLEIAMGLVNEPKVLFLDEPTTGLDPETRRALWLDLKRLRTERNVTVLLTTHYLEEADTLCDRLSIVDHGRVVVEGTPDSLKADIAGDTITVDVGEAAARACDDSYPGRRRERGDPRRRVDDGAGARRRHRRAGGRRCLEPSGHCGAHDDGGPCVARRRLSQTHRTPLRRRGCARRGRQAMIYFLADTWHLMLRHLRATIRLPIWIAMALIQPVIWLTLFGQLFRRVVDLPGFETGSYIEFLAPGVLIMTAMFGGAWSGMGLIDDLHHNVVDRMLATPVHRAAVIAARVLHASITVIVQSIIVLLLALALGAGWPSVAGTIGVLLAAALVTAGFAAMSTGIALLTRRELIFTVVETMIAVVNFFGLPLAFLSATFMSAQLMPEWMQTASKFNPVNWAVSAARHAVLGTDESAVWINSGLLLIFTVVMVMFATMAFRVYRRSA